MRIRVSVDGVIRIKFVSILNSKITFYTKEKKKKVKDTTAETLEKTKSNEHSLQLQNTTMVQISYKSWNNYVEAKEVCDFD